MSSTLKNRINKLESKVMKTSTYESLLDRHSIETEHCPKSLDKMLLIDCVIALQVKDCRGHRLGTKAGNFLSWVANSGLNLIDRANALIEEQINAGYMSIRPEPIDVSILDTTPRVPPYTWFCTADQLCDCTNKPFWVAE